MCTVSFVPVAETHCILTSNRDEAVARGLASVPSLISKDTYKVVCPLDPFASGTWIAASDYRDVVCLLNGAFKRHKRQLPYRKSRGLVVLDYFDTGDPEKFTSEYDLHNIEPFTMVIVHTNTHYAHIDLFELRWDGERKYFKKLDEQQFHLWSSSTLYSDDIAEEKKKQFGLLLQNEKEVSSEKIMGIHSRFLYEEWVKPPERVDVVSTLSITSTNVHGDSLDMLYIDLVRKEMPVNVISLDISQGIQSDITSENS